MHKYQNLVANVWLKGSLETPRNDGVEDETRHIKKNIATIEPLSIFEFKILFLISKKGLNFSKKSK
jgi:hypothetical protein